MRGCARVMGGIFDLHIFDLAVFWWVRCGIVSICVELRVIMGGSKGGVEIRYLSSIALLLKMVSREQFCC